MQSRARSDIDSGRRHVLAGRACWPSCQQLRAPSGQLLWSSISTRDNAPPGLPGTSSALHLATSCISARIRGSDHDVILTELHSNVDIALKPRKSNHSELLVQRGLRRPGSIRTEGKFMEVRLVGSQFQAYPLSRSNFPNSNNFS